MKDQIAAILKDGHFHSGEKMSQQLNITRSAVWKYMKKLKEDGYVIESVTNRGYRLLESPDLLTEPEIKNGLCTKKIGQRIFYDPEVDSTNNEAKRNHDAPDGSVFIAEIQTGGKGRLGRNWVSGKGEGIWMSILLKPQLAPDRVSIVTLAAGLSVAETLSELRLPAKIKWPNDVVVGGRKVCGILTEMSAEVDALNYLVVGMGINVNTEKFEGELLEKATSVYLESGEKYNRAEMARQILERFEKRYEQFVNGEEKAMISDYEKMCVTVGRKVRVIRYGEEFEAVAVGITPKGELMVDKDGDRIILNSGEVSVRGIYGYI